MLLVVESAVVILRKAVLKYGHIVLLCLLDQKTKTEHYEDCALILQALKYSNRKTGLKLPLIYTPELVDEWLSSMTDYTIFDLYEEVREVEILMSPPLFF